MQNLNSLVTDRLQQMKQNPQSKDSPSLYEHLSQLLPQLGAFQGDKVLPITNLQYISEYLKKHHYSPKSPLSEQQLHHFLSTKVEYPHWLAQEHTLYGFKVKDSSERIIANFEQHSERLFSKVGVGFGREESYRIQTALKRLAEEKKTIRVRFWGKILTKAGDYLVIEGASKQLGEAASGLDVEKAREGANYNTYWVSQNSLGSEWTELPLVTPQQLRAAKLIKYAFSGDLNKTVISSPPFDGQEKHLLKAQLVRITHNCEIVPKGLYAPLEDNPDEVDFAEEFKMPEFTEQSNLENWVHFNPYILKQGRATYFVDPKLPEDQKEEFLAKLGESDPKIERLKAINEDKGLQKFGLEGCWSVRTYGTTQLFNNVGKEEGTTSCYAVVALKNPHWPGWITVSSAKEFASIYVGYGLKASQLPFHPVGPEDIGLEAEDVEECHEPNPKDPPDELEPDSDDENKKVEE